MAALPGPGAGAVEAAVAQDDALKALGLEHRRLQVPDGVQGAPQPAGGSGSSASSSVLTGPPARANGHPAKLWATTRLAPAARAASTRWSVPSVRRRLVAANPWSNLRRSVTPARAVSW